MPKYYLLGTAEKVLGLQDGHNYFFLNESGKWVASPLACDLINLGHSWALPPEHSWGYPGHAREISATEAKAICGGIASDVDPTRFLVYDGDKIFPADWFGD